MYWPFSVYCGKFTICLLFTVTVMAITAVNGKLLLAVLETLEYSL